MTRMAGQQPIAVVDGRPITLADLEAAYASKNHIVDGGPEVGLFWASNISTTEHFDRKPIEHGLKAIADHARQMLPGRQLAAGDAESEMVARLVPAAMMMGADPAAVVKEYVAARNR